MRTGMILRGAILGAFAAVLFAVGAADAEKGRREQVEEQQFYTKNNIWYQHQAKIYNVNYHMGTILPLGSKVTIKRIRGEYVDFHVEGRNGVWRIYFFAKYAAPKETIWDYFAAYFQKEDPYAPGGSFDMISEDEQRLIKTGQIAAGMSKWAVLRSYGYPPGHATSSWKEDTWTYWVTRGRKKVVTFQSDRVTSISG